MSHEPMSIENRFVRYCGIEIRKDTDSVCSLINIMPEHRNLYGIVHGGLLYTLADAAAGVAVRNILENPVTLNSDFQFLRQMSEGTLKARTNIIHAGKHIARVEVKVEAEDGILLAEGIFTYYSNIRQQKGENDNE